MKVTTAAVSLAVRRVTVAWTPLSEGDQPKLRIFHWPFGNPWIRSYSTGLTLRAGGFPQVFLLFSWGGSEGTHTIANVNTWAAQHARRCIETLARLDGTYATLPSGSSRSNSLRVRDQVLANGWGRGESSKALTTTSERSVESQASQAFDKGSIPVARSNV